MFPVNTQGIKIEDVNKSKAAGATHSNLGFVFGRVT
jgi:hypothetical protein